MRTFRSLTAELLHLLAPRRCLGCDETSPSPFCRACQPLLEPAAGPSAVFQYGGPVADAIHRYKYQRRSEMAGRLGALLANQSLSLAGSVDVVVPVPLHWKRRRWRGFDQAALLARPVASALGVPARLRGLRRVRNTASQVDLPQTARRDNVQGAFECWKLGAPARVLLIDDVRTTGATMDAAAGALHAAGVEVVHTLVLATRVLSCAT